MAGGAQWSAVRAFLTAHTGMALSVPQIRRLDERLVARCQGLTPHQYLMFLKSPAGTTDLEDLVAALVVNKTDLFRDDVQLAAFRSQVLTPLVARLRRPLRVWSAGCATGEEVATLLVLLAEAGADPGSTVLGTDIAGDVLHRARWLAFSREQLNRVPPELRARYFTRAGAKESLAPALRERASFQSHNLMATPYPEAPGGGGFDVIFCRNVLIYFTAEAFQSTVAALAASLAPGGTLVLSASEPLLQVPPSLRVHRGAQAFFYVRPEEAAPDAAGTVDARGEVNANARAVSPPGRARPSRGARGNGVPEREGPSLREGADRRRGAVGTRPNGASVWPETSGSTMGAGEGRGLGVSPRPGTDSGAARGPGLSQAPVTGAGLGADPSPPSGPDAFLEADLLFACVLDGAASGVPDSVSERDLRRCLALDPDHAAARYLLGLLLEQCRRAAEATIEYRQALQSLEAGRARPVPFFLNPDRLRIACAHAAERLESSRRRR
ncbi:Chemotaxis protein methyltransferase CheR [Myxococcus hansupus]|uniref:Chemotaxis protein methyltransferase CheR n=1 Tax=Pseudomyxococcus hansupus TaxID=1297742 RepID=A0A0H4WU34_9BACT|nr:CheR family methyltransferase [Myxococcus hansupus]AKQ64820.1 Chemotaxis protein methyltransferase CheR [Myxococcus hansupus]